MEMGRGRMIYHIIAYTLLSITLLRMAYALIRKNNALNEVLYYNEQIIERFNEVFDELVRTAEELQLTKNTRDIYKEDRDALIQNIKGLIPGSGE